MQCSSFLLVQREVYWGWKKQVLVKAMTIGYVIIIKYNYIMMIVLLFQHRSFQFTIHLVVNKFRHAWDDFYPIFVFLKKYFYGLVFWPSEFGTQTWKGVSKRRPLLRKTKVGAIDRTPLQTTFCSVTSNSNVHWIEFSFRMKTS